MGIRDWPSTERPRERLLSCGAARLSDAELLAVFLRTGSRGRSALDLARHLLGAFGSVSAILAADRDALLSERGFGIARYCELSAAKELLRRALREDLARKDALGSPGAVRDFLRLKLRDLQHEVFMGLYLDAQNRVIGDEELFRGTLTQTSVYPREVVKRALAHNAAAVILAHNHPSGVAEPSHADEALTRALKQALALVDVKVLDHFVIAGNAAVSFAERGLL
ncbi:MAG: DNA repair protein RadC [Burkholderiales bacterium]|nr:DNA repair protein RadC [Burkholderiales bacterium]